MNNTIKFLISNNDSEKRLDIFKRGHNLKRVEIDSSFPKYIHQNKIKLKKWIV